MKKRTMLAIFAATQIVGLLCSWFSHHPYSKASAQLWGTGFITLFPGNILGSMIVDELRWEYHLTNATTDIITIAAVVAINSILWFAAVKVCWLIHRQRQAIAFGKNASECEQPAEEV